MARPSGRGSAGPGRMPRRAGRLPRAALLLMLTAWVLLVLGSGPRRALAGRTGQHSNYGQWAVVAETRRQALADAARLSPTGAEAARDAAARAASRPEAALFDYFALNDHDMDGFLDGHELFMSFMVAHPNATDDAGAPSAEQQAALEADANAGVHAAALPDRLSLADLRAVVAEVMDEDDRDGDGRISWEEYLASQWYHGQVPAALMDPTDAPLPAA